MLDQIHFGTSGYRGIIGQSFTVKHVDAIAFAIARYLRSQKKSPSVLIGYDTRIGNDPGLSDGSYTRALCNRLKYEGIDVTLCETFTSTPALSWAIRTYSFSGGIMLTASHNPAQYNGIKFNGPDGAPAPVSVTEQLAAYANAHLAEPDDDYTNADAEVTRRDVTSAFVDHCIYLVSTDLKLPLKDLAKMPIVVDARFGTSSMVWKQLKAKLGLKKLQILNGAADSNFGLISPNPSDHTEAISQAIHDHEAVIGIAHDPDSDRHVIFDENGRLVRPETLCALFTDFLLSRDIKVSQLLTTLASSGIVRMVAERNHLNFHETAVGFKYFTPFLKESKQSGTISLAVESSGGFSMSLHTLEKCGFLPALLTISILKATGDPLSSLVKKLKTSYANFHFQEQKIDFPISQYPQIQQQLQAVDNSMLLAFFKEGVQSISLLDGIKVTFEDNSWILVRGSGTEPVIRLYSESPKSDAHSQSLQELGVRFLEHLFVPQEA